MILHFVSVHLKSHVHHLKHEKYIKLFNILDLFISAQFYYQDPIIIAVQLDLATEMNKYS